MFVFLLLFFCVDESAIPVQYFCAIFIYNRTAEDRSFSSAVIFHRGDSLKGINSFSRLLYLKVRLLSFLNSA